MRNKATVSTGAVDSILNQNLKLNLKKAIWLFENLLQYKQFPIICDTYQRI